MTIYASDSQLEADAQQWRLEQLRSLCTVARPSDKGKTLGIGFGVRAAEFQTKNEVAQRMHDRLRRMEHTGAELALSQACVGVAKVTHFSRRVEMNSLRRLQPCRSLIEYRTALWIDWCQAATMNPGCKLRWA